MKFWREAAERAIKTGAQFAAPVWAATVFTAVGEVVPTGRQPCWLLCPVLVCLC